jgi:hypothetical protein
MSFIAKWGPFFTKWTILLERNTLLYQLKSLFNSTGSPVAALLPEKRLPNLFGNQTGRVFD